ncbi:MAG: tRNA 2-selenouridine(34) synthase MnmH [Bacteroidota bacterium]
MAIEKIDINRFIELGKTFPVLDVRSPGEYAHAHIPGAFSLPLFTDEERKVVGTAYKQQSKQQAIKIGLKYFGPKMVTMVEEVEALVSTYNNNKPHTDTLTNDPMTIIVHCWRGGMRSAGVAWLLSLYGFKVYTIVGGYKAYRGWARKQFEKDYELHVLGGYTGSAKTKILHQMASKGQSIIDLEGLANHKGSAFGKIGMPPQPSQEMFENLLAENLFSAQKIASVETTNNEAIAHCSLQIANGKLPVANGIWLEDESQRIGDVMLPDAFWKLLRRSPVYFLDIPFEERLHFLVQDYAAGQTEEFVNAIIRIKKRLGGLEAKTAIHYLLEGDMKEAFRVLLSYYDKWYKKGLYSRNDIDLLLVPMPFQKVLDQGQAEALIAKYMAKKEAAPEEAAA